MAMFLARQYYVQLLCLFCSLWLFMSHSIPTLTIPPPGIPGVNKVFVHKCPEAGKIFPDECPGGREKVTGQLLGGREFCFQPCHRSIEFIVSDVVNCFNIWYSEGTQRISDTFNTF